MVSDEFKGPAHDPEDEAFAMAFGEGRVTLKCSDCGVFEEKEYATPQEAWERVKRLRPIDQYGISMTYHKDPAEVAAREAAQGAEDATIRRLWRSVFIKQEADMGQLYKRLAECPSDGRRKGRRRLGGRFKWHRASV